MTNPAILDALQRAETFMEGFDDDDQQENIADHLRAIRNAISILSVQVQDADGLSQWEGWDGSRGFWSQTKHRDAVMHAMFRGPWSMEDAATLLGFIDRTWPKVTAQQTEAIASEPPSKVHDVAALADDIERLEVDYNISEFYGLADWAAFRAGIAKGRAAAAELVRTRAPGNLGGK
ncbi:hypothetical protein CFBP6625_06660 [Agrobacterium tumefaciens]|jgi:hypothetical protein|nr:hypothetical protein CFBP6625_06660 [Agrobacterium tumefaciens]